MSMTRHPSVPITGDSAGPSPDRSFQLPASFVESTPRRIRVRLGDELVAESDRAQLLVQYGPGGLPTYYLPHDDVRPGALVDESTDPDGQRSWAVRAGNKRAEV